MKYIGLSALFSIAVVSASWAAPVQQWGVARVKSVKIYPEGVYLTLSMPVSLRAGVEEKFMFPDLWFADPQTVEIRLSEGAANDGIGLVTEVSPAVRADNVGVYREVCSLIDSVRAEVEKLRADSIVLQRELDFLTANARQETGSVKGLSELAGWMRERYADLYERQRLTNEQIRSGGEELGRRLEMLDQLETRYDEVTLASVRATSPEACTAELELSYYARAARWDAFYFFRFEPKSDKAELEYQATIQQWSGFDWDRVPAELCYGSPARTIYLPHYYVNKISYQPPVKVADELNGAKQDRKLGYATNARSIPSASETDVSYLLMQPLTLGSNPLYSDRDSRQMVRVRRDTVSAAYGYEVQPSGKVLLTAHIPDWQRLYLTSGRMTVFCDGRMLGQSNLSVRSAGDTLSIPLAVEPLVVVDRAEVGDYKERVSGAKVERRRSYEIKIKNNKEFPVALTVRDQYPVSNTDEVEVTLEESTGAQVDAASGMLTWKQELAPGEAKTLVFTYSVRYPKEGTITGYY